MNVTIELQERAVAALDARARAAHMPRETYLARIVEEALVPDQGHERLRKPRKSAYGLLAEYGPGSTEAEIDENRREMFQGFGETGP